MREREELDALLPELLAAMGHQVLSKPQTGVRQGGVDCLSSSVGELIGLCLCGKREAAHVLAKNTLTRLSDALRKKQFLPISSDSLEDYYGVALYGDEDPLECFRTSTVVPMLGSFAAATDAQDLLDELNRAVLPQMRDVTLERW
jgi:hypothetical protein